MLIERIELPVPQIIYHCLLPINVPVSISQGFNGPYSHHAIKKTLDRGHVLIIDDRFAVDFEVPVNTAIFAAKSGVVAGALDNLDYIYQGYDKTIGMNTWTNSIMIDHPDGTTTLYSHLAKGSSRVFRDQPVVVGELLAFTGLSGWVPTPHLHFELFLTADLIERKSQLFIFDDYDGELDHRVLYP